MFEIVYERALVAELELRGMGVERQVLVPIVYKGRPVGESRIDLLVENELVVELKAVDTLLAIHTAQVVCYLRAGAFPIGLLLNFNVTMMKFGIRRVVVP